MKSLLLFLFLSTSLAAQESLTEYQQVLLPVYAEGGVTGANGALFVTSLSVFSTRDFKFYPGSPDFFQTVPAMTPLLPIRSSAGTAPGGRVVWIERSAASDVHLGYTLVSTDAAAIAPEQRTALPVVRAREFRQGRIDLLNIPARPIISYPEGVAGVVSGERFRHMLRIYDPTRYGSAVATVRIAVANVAGDTTLETLVVPIDRVDGADPSYPFYAQLPLDLPCLPFSLHTPCAGYNARVSITVEPDIQYWAFVSTTDNLTQQVSISAPQ